jgi:hypothetical protein
MEQHCPIAPIFDKRYKAVVRKRFTPYYFEMLNWANEHSKGQIAVSVCSETTGDVYFAFENEDDALVFKIKYSG